MMTINAPEAMDSLVHVVKEAGGDFKYQRPTLTGDCKYVHEGAPSCGVGKALTHLGVPLDVVAELDTANCGTSLGAHAMRPFLLVKGVDVAWSALEVFASFQVAQDKGVAYSSALEATNRLYSSLEKK